MTKTEFLKHWHPDVLDLADLDTFGDVEHVEMFTNAARLIAAAPDLLAALRDLVAQHDRPHGFNDEHWYATEVAAARAAIAKVQS